MTFSVTFRGNGSTASIYWPAGLKKMAMERVAAGAAEKTTVPMAPARLHAPSTAKDDTRYARECVGKITDLMFDHCGDFAGLVLSTVDREHTFFSREKPVEELAKRAWHERARISIWIDLNEPQRPLAILIRELPLKSGGRG